MGDVYDNNFWNPTSDVLNVVRQTFSILSQDLPVRAQSEVETQLGLKDTLMEVSKWASSLSPEVRSRAIGMCMKHLWTFTRECIERGNSISFPLYIFVAFTQPRITRCIFERGDVAAHVTSHCVGALVVNKLAAAAINKRTLHVNDAELACLSAILGTDSQDVAHWLSRPGAIQFANIVFFVSDDSMMYGSQCLTSDVGDVVRRTLRIISQAVQAQLGAEIRPDLTSNLMNVFEGTLTFLPVTHSGVLREFLKNLWHFTRAYIERSSSAPLPPYVYIIFTHPVITRRILEKGDIATHVTRRCVGALVVNKLAVDIKSSIIPVNDAELACLSAILHSESRDVRLCLTQPGIVELINIASLVLGHVDSLDASQVPPDLRVVLHQTLGILSQGIPAQENAEVYPVRMVPLSNISTDRIQRAIVSRLRGFLKICLSSASPLAEEVRTSCLRMCLKTLWHSGKAYHRTSDPLPPYLPLILASPEIIHHLQAEKDPVARLTGCCFGALIASKLMDTLESPVSLHGHDQDAKLECISAILSPGRSENLLTPYQLHIMNYRKVVWLILGEIDTWFTDSEGMPVDTLRGNILLVDTAKLTLHILADRLRDSRFIPGWLRMDQRQLPQETDIEDAIGLHRRKQETLIALTRLRWKLEILIPAVGKGVR
ncbi:hypothetical protein V8E53_004769 [Lactarius tabidus]